MPISDYPSVLEIKDPLHGYIELSSVEKSILDLRLTQRLRNIRGPAGIHLVFPGADMSVMGRLLGGMHVTKVFFDSLDGDLDEVQRARLVAMLLTLSTGPWNNVMTEYLTVRGTNQQKLASLIAAKSPVKDIIKDSVTSISEIKNMLERGVSLKSFRLDLTKCPINPVLIDNLERDAYFAGVEYAQLEYRRLFAATRIAKNKIALNRSSMHTFEAYLSAGVNMYDAVYYHRTVRAAELMLLRILDEAGSQLFLSPDDDIEQFLLYDDLSFLDVLVSVNEDSTSEMQTASSLYKDIRKRYLIKLASERAISDVAFMKKISTPDGLFQVESEIAETADIDPRNVFVDYPDRASVTYYPGKFPLDELVFFERGSKGYEFWPVDEVSLIARSFNRDLRPVRVYTTRGYRSKVKKAGDKLLESVDVPGSIA